MPESYPLILQHSLRLPPETKQIRPGKTSSSSRSVLGTIRRRAIERPGYGMVRCTEYYISATSTVQFCTVQGTSLRRQVFNYMLLDRTAFIILECPFCSIVAGSATTSSFARLTTTAAPSSIHGTSASLADKFGQTEAEPGGTAGQK